MKRTDVAVISKSFREAVSSGLDLSSLLPRLQRAKWVSSTTKVSVIDGLKAISRSSDREVPALVTSFDHGAFEEYLTNIFQKSFEENIAEIKRNKRIHPALRVQVIDEYLKFLSFYRDTRASTGSVYYWHPFIPARVGNGILNDVQEWSSNRDGFNIFIYLRKARLAILGDFPKDTIFEPQSNRSTSFNFAKKILRDPFFSKYFKSQFLFHTLNLTKTTQTQANALKAVRLVDFEDIGAEKFSFGGKSKNWQNAFFKRKIFFAYFFILLEVCKFERKPISLLYSSALLDLAIELNETFYEVSLSPKPKISADSLKSLLNDFYRTYSV
jgi:hypothetical protein